MDALYLFNPENDLALACNTPYYVPPASARRMAAELAVLPAWYAGPGATVRVPDVARADAFLRACPLALPVGFASVADPIYNKVYPWGWNPALLRELREAGWSQAMLPDDCRMAQIRALSGRQVAVKVLQRCRERLAGTVGTSCLLSTVGEVDGFVRSHGQTVLKAPWSGSGRGIQHASRELSASLRGWVERMLRTQGCVVGELFCDRVADFALEFRADASGDVSFVGYSLFETDTRGSYKENVLDSDAGLEHRLAAYVPVAGLRRLRRVLREELAAALQGRYEGYLGVDMMVCRTPSGYAVHPCVEINLRMNMGVVARLVYGRYVAPSACGRYVVEYYASPGDALRADAALRRAHPPVVEGNRLCSGYLSLTPVDDTTGYQVYLLVAQSVAGRAMEG